MRGVRNVVVAEVCLSDEHQYSFFSQQLVGET